MGFRVENRQKAIRILEQGLSECAHYAGPPTFAYSIGDVTIDRNGYVEARSDEELERIKLMLIGDALDADELHRIDEGVSSLQSSAHSLRNLLNMVHSKQYLLEQALGYRAFCIHDDLVKAISEKEMSADAILALISTYETEGLLVRNGVLHITGFPAGRCFERLTNAMTEYAEGRKYISPDETLSENEKYYMRSWLLRMGLGGAENKEIRQVMLKNLKGHTAFRTKEEVLHWKEKHGCSCR